MTSRNSWLTTYAKRCTPLWAIQYHSDLLEPKSTDVLLTTKKTAKTNDGPTSVLGRLTWGSTPSDGMSISAFCWKSRMAPMKSYAAVSLSDLCQCFISVITCQRLCRNSGDFAVDRWFADEQKIPDFCSYTVDYRRFDVGVRPLSYIGYVGG